MSQKRSYELTEAISRLIMQQPFFAVLLLDLLSLSETDAIPTAGTNGKQLLVNPEWFGKLTLNERVFVICHEVMHVILEHQRRTKLYMDRGIGPDMKAFNPEKMNVAEDYIINDWVIHSGQNDMPKGGCLDPKFGYNDLADDVYGHLVELADSLGGGLLDEEDFARFTFSNAAALFAGSNPGFFEGTEVEAAVRAGFVLRSRTPSREASR